MVVIVAVQLPRIVMLLLWLLFMLLLLLLLPLIVAVIAVHLAAVSIQLPSCFFWLKIANEVVVCWW